MKKFKKTAAVLISVLIIFSANVFAFAENPYEYIASDYEATESTPQDSSFTSFGISLEVGDEVSLEEISDYNSWYEGDVYLSYLYNGLGDKDDRKIVRVENNRIYALNEGTAYVEVKSDETGEKLWSITVQVKAREADNFAELLELSFLTFGKSISSVFETIGAAFLSVAFGVVTPFVTAFMAVFSIFT